MLRMSKSQNLEIRTETEGEKVIEGYFAVFNSPTELWPGVNEQIANSAFKSIGDVRALINHDDTLVLGRTKSNTLEIIIDDKGLYGKIKVNENDRAAMDLYSRVQRGDIDQCSFGFIINDEEYLTNSDGSTLITLKDVDLREISVCTFPAYPQTSVQARKQDLEQYESKKLNIIKENLLRRLKNGTKETNVNQ
ncbi:HK97 family phage prohead protease [Peptoanaerobacter stomatis]|uniref:HK97 family phage prohead protease n=1 Tax=Peptoanaerobacter stomatis TaxID=796937 RepID=V9HQV9_9FIRM|nr:HK97 family phage prohead protease [Peptoanaerobacter stomatis]EHL17396.1 HK97 family phage prohead protease [Peptoanaerobacter stomatis]